MDDVNIAAGEAKLWALAREPGAAGRAGDYNQALMDLGATVCRPRAATARPARCSSVRGLPPGRAGAAAGSAARPARPVRVYAAGVVRKRGRVLIVQRAADALLGGLWAFPASECAPSEDMAGCLARGLRDTWGLDAAVGAQTQTLAHGFTHFTLSLHVFECEWRASRARHGAPPAKWVWPAELSDFPMGKTDRQIAEWVQASKTRP